MARKSTDGERAEAGTRRSDPEPPRTRKTEREPRDTVRFVFTDFASI